MASSEAPEIGAAPNDFGRGKEIGILFPKKPGVAAGLESKLKVVDPIICSDTNTGECSSWASASS